MGKVQEDGKGDVSELELCSLNSGIDYDDEPSDSEYHLMEHDEEGVSRRAMNSTLTSMSMRAVDPTVLLGKTIEIQGRTGKVIEVVSQKGASTLHKIAFEDGETQTLQLAKKTGAKGLRFHIEKAAKLSS